LAAIAWRAARLAAAVPYLIKRLQCCRRLSGWLRIFMAAAAWLATLARAAA